ncbi:MAG: twin-arginine translocation signal domain-containing protein [Planctomycetota bacterium]|jgi:hypothetical protein
MTKSINKSNVNRRQFLKKCGSLATGAAVLGSIAPVAFAGEDNTIRLALLGCGGRGTGAVGDALSVPKAGPIKLYATADLIDAKMERSIKSLKKKFPDKIDVSEDRKFRGFDAYRRAIDILRPGDVAMCTIRAVCIDCSARDRRPRGKASRSSPGSSAVTLRPARH